MMDIRGVDYSDCLSEESKPSIKDILQVAKKRTLKRSQQLVDEFVDEGIPLTELGFGDLEADTQRAIEESLKDAHGAHRGPLPPVMRKCLRSKKVVLQTKARQDQDTVYKDEGSGSEGHDATSQPQPGQMDEEFTATAYPNIQENLKLTVDDLVIPEEPASSTGTLSSLQHLAKDVSFGDQFFNDKPQKPIMRRQHQIQKLNQWCPLQSIKTPLLSLLTSL
ncbi:hypothetical protein Tco_0054397 [Tanacetum coccineum]